jgi:hypothetical protein
LISWTTAVHESRFSVVFHFTADALLLIPPPSQQQQQQQPKSTRVDREKLIIKTLVYGFQQRDKTHANKREKA